jgi:hypothetical protein
LPRQRSEQYFTSSQTFSHFLRHTKGLAQTGQVFVGKSLFFRMGGIRASVCNPAFIGVRIVDIVK